MSTVQYHRTHDEREYALEYVHQSEAAAQDDRNDRDEPAIVRPIDLDDRYYGVYVTRPVEKHSTDGVDVSSIDDQYLVDSVLSIFDVIDDEQDLNWYKPLEPNRIADALDRVEWHQSVPVVGGQILSNLILAHGLPNANHRTALGFLNAYLATMDASFEAPTLTTSGNDWLEWIDAFIVDSKRLLTLSRNPRLFAWLADHGATQVDRKDGVRIDLADQDLSGNDPWGEIAERHEDRSIAFVRTYLDQAGADDLAGATDDGKNAFRQRL
ncbi:MAG: hypothetical protein ACOCYZ_02625 [Halococcoides sp.]